MFPCCYFHLPVFFLRFIANITLSSTADSTINALTDGAAFLAVSGELAVAALTEVVRVHMIDRKKISCIKKPDHILCNREGTLTELKQCLSQLDLSMSNKEKDRNMFKIPMLAGPSGIGKTSVLQALYTAPIPIQIKCHVTYYNGYAPSFNEHSRFNASTSLYLRMIYMIFLDGNSMLALSHFMDKVYECAHIQSLSDVDAMMVVYQLYSEIDDTVKPRLNEEIGPRLRILLCFDECHEVNDFIKVKHSKDSHSALDDICQSLLNVMVTGQCLFSPELTTKRRCTGLPVARLCTFHFLPWIHLRSCIVSSLLETSRSPQRLLCEPTSCPVRAQLQISHV